MNAAHRDWYLNALGIVRYVPRDRYEVVPEKAPAAAMTAGAEAPATDAPRPKALKDTVATAVAPAAPDGKQAQGRPAAVPAVDEKAEAPETIHFRLAFWQPSAQLVVLSSMPSGSRPSRAQQEMLANLLRAIGHLGEGLPQVELLDWPLSPGTDASLPGARELLTAFLDVKHQLKPFARALLMGETAARLVDDGKPPPVGEMLKLNCGAEGIVTHSLYEMDRDQSLKRGTWEAIRFLAGQRS